MQKPDLNTSDLLLRLSISQQLGMIPIIQDTLTDKEWLAPVNHCMIMVSMRASKAPALNLSGDDGGGDGDGDNDDDVDDSDNDDDDDDGDYGEHLSRMKRVALFFSPL